MPTFPTEGHVPTIYKPPQRGFVSYLPPQWVPYAELMRVAKPVGVMNIYFPYLFGTLYAACISQPIVPPNQLFAKNLELFAAAFMLRSGGCTWNDIIDRDFDRQVTRCRLRPMARGAISLRNGYFFTGAQCLIWLGILSQISFYCILYALPLILMVGFYPFAKRITDHAQVVLGFTLAWGVLIGSMALEVDPVKLITEQTATTGAGLVTLYMSYVIWTIIHDIIYAFQDLQDDLKAGIKSMAVRYREWMGLVLPGLTIVLLGLIIFSGRALDAGLIYYLGGAVGPSLLMLSMIRQINLNDPGECWWWFQSGCLIVGVTISAGLLGEYVGRLKIS